MVDIHCHVIAGIDDGATSMNQSLAMAQMAVEDGIRTIVATPHQLGQFSDNSPERIRELVGQLQLAIDEAKIPLTVLPGADVRIEPNLVDRINADEVTTLADHRQHVLLELPHEVYFPLTALLRELQSAGLVGILSHPERNRGLLSQPTLVDDLVDQGCLMQLTAGSITGGFGAASRRFAERMLTRGLAHFVATDAHGTRERRPRLSPARARVVELTSEEDAARLFDQNPTHVVLGSNVVAGRHQPTSSRKTWLKWKRGA